MQNDKYIDAGTWRLWWGVRRSIRYHDRRIVWYEMIARWGRFFGIFSATGVVVTLMKEWEAAAIVLGLVCGFLAALELAFDATQRARLHGVLKVRFVELAREMTAIGLHEIAEKGQLNRLTAKRLEIEQDEPPVLHFLNIVCHNELCRADGLEQEKQFKLRWWQHLLAHVWYGRVPEATT